MEFSRAPVSNPPIMSSPDPRFYAGLGGKAWSILRACLPERRGPLQPVDLGAAIATAITVLRPELRRRGVHLYASFAFSSARITAERAALQRLVWDLLAHAAVSTERGHGVDVRLARVNGEARLTVHASHARAASTAGRLAFLPGTTREFDPSELREQLERWHGRLIPHPATPAGMAWTLTLPLRAVDAPRMSRAEENASRREAPLAGRSVLVVDDHEDAREVVAALLESCGAHTHAYGSGSDTLGHLRSRPRGEWPDVLVADVGLPGMDGYTLLRSVRRLEAERGTPLSERVPAIALTGFAEVSDRARAVLAGFQAHLAKPVDPAELVESVERLLAPPAKHRG
jgi:ATP-binding cassette subfamily B protein